MQNDHSGYRPATSEPLSLFNVRGRPFITIDDRMRWFLVVALVLALLASIVVVVITKKPLTLSIPGSILLALRPIIRWLFPQEGNGQSNTKQDP